MGIETYVLNDQNAICVCCGMPDRYLFYLFTLIYFAAKSRNHAGACAEPVEALADGNPVQFAR